MIYLWQWTTTKISGNSVTSLIIVLLLILRCLYYTHTHRWLVIIWRWHQNLCTPLNGFFQLITSLFAS